MDQAIVGTKSQGSLGKPNGEQTRGVRGKYPHLTVQEPHLVEATPSQQQGNIAPNFQGSGSAQTRRRNLRKRKIRHEKNWLSKGRGRSRKKRGTGDHAQGRPSILLENP